MEWKDEYSVGIPEIDQHHKILIDCVSLIEKAVTEQEKWSAVHSALGRLAQFVQIHFAVEESLMRIHEYPELAQHVEQHCKFSSDLQALQEKSLRADVSLEMIGFIHDWVHRHIMTSDKHYAWYLPQAGVRPTISPIFNFRKWLRGRLVRRPGY